MFVTPEQVKTILKTNHLVIVKYVRVGDEYRFVGMDGWPIPNHDSMLKAGETPVSAAFCKVYRDRVDVEGHSMTLKMGPAPDDICHLSRIFMDGVSREKSLSI